MNLLQTHTNARAQYTLHSECDVDSIITLLINLFQVWIYEAIVAARIAKAKMQIDARHS